MLMVLHERDFGSLYPWGIMKVRGTQTCEPHVGLRRKNLYSFFKIMIADCFHYWQFAFQNSLHRDRKELMETEAYELQQRSPWKSNNNHAMQACHLCLSHKHHGMPVPIINQAGCTAFRMTGLVERIGSAVIKLYAYIQVPRGWIMPTLMCHLLLPGGSNFQCTATRLMLWFWKLENLFCTSE